jgi:hypothetical protein
MKETEIMHDGFRFKQARQQDSTHSTKKAS